MQYSVRLTRHWFHSKAKKQPNNKISCFYNNEKTTQDMEKLGILMNYIKNQNWDLNLIDSVCYLHWLKERI